MQYYHYYYYNCALPHRRLVFACILKSTCVSTCQCRVILVSVKVTPRRTALGESILRNGRGAGGDEDGAPTQMARVFLISAPAFFADVLPLT